MEEQRQQAGQRQRAAGSDGGGGPGLAGLFLADRGRASELHDIGRRLAAETPRGIKVHVDNKGAKWVQAESINVF